MKKYDFIGDVHGFANKLIELLIKLGYEFKNNTFSHPEGRMAVFVGDYIDRGIEEEKVIDVIKNMVETGNAFAIMGNHEYNAICYDIKLQNGSYLRKHNDKNNHQHKEFLKEYEFQSKKHKEAIAWFKNLPLFLELDGANVVHASWCEKDIALLKPLLSKNNTLNDYILKEVEKKGEIHNAIERLLKGIKLYLPDNIEWKDKDGFFRNTMRFNWYDKKNKDNITYKNCALSLPDELYIPDIKIENPPETYSSDTPVFFGHYWLKGTPKIQNNKASCLDYSVAKGGNLVAYRWNGEQILDNSNYIY